MARLELILGCMFSGKSTELIRRCQRHQALGNFILVVNSSRDTRSDLDVVQTHDKCVMACIKTDDLFQLDIEPYKVIAIDEAQFFTGLQTFVQRALALKKHVIIAGLDGDFEQREFGEILNLVPHADEITKLYALCMMCKNGTLAPFTRRITDEKEQEVIGDERMYIAVCRTCLGMPNNKKSTSLTHIAHAIM